MRRVVGVLAIALLLLAATCSSGERATPTFTPHPTLPHPTFTLPPTNSPKPTPPASCPDSWDDCAKRAVTAAFTLYSDTYHPAPNSIGAASDNEYVEWPDRCLGVETPGVVCAQVITPGYRIIVRSDETLPEVEYHTDLNGHAVAFATMTVPPAPSP